jgi:uncharacterized membrane protein YcfT
MEKLILANITLLQCAFKFQHEMFQSHLIPPLIPCYIPVFYLFILIFLSLLYIKIIDISGKQRQYHQPSYAAPYFKIGSKIRVLRVLKQIFTCSNQVRPRSSWRWNMNSFIDFSKNEHQYSSSKTFFNAVRKFLAYNSSTLKMEAIFSSESSCWLQRTVQCYIAEDGILQIYTGYDS